jgi:ABC-type dipeptide/oligopeptide/nickel transport system permease subunit
MNVNGTTWQRIRESDLVHYYKRDKVAIAASSIFLILMLMALFSPVIAPFDPYDLTQIDLMDSEMPPVWQEGADQRFLLGTDDQGRDLWSTILYGMRVSLLIGICAVLLQAAIGIVIGLVSGYVGGRVDNILMRIADVQLSFSTLMVAIIVLAIVKNAFGGETYSNYAMLILILVIGIAEWPQIARTVRSSVLAEKEKEYVDAAVVMGFGAIRIICHRHGPDRQRHHYRGGAVFPRPRHAGNRAQPRFADQHRQGIPVFGLLVDYADTRLLPGGNRHRHQPDGRLFARRVQPPPLQGLTPPCLTKSFPRQRESRINY